MRVAVLASGSGSNLQALLDSLRSPEGARVILVVSDKSSAGALDRARAAGVPTHVLSDPSDAAAMLGVLREAETDLVVLAGYLRLVPAEVVRAFRDMMINLHPALLPSFGGKGMYGSRVHQAVLDSGATVTGVTVHIVSEEYDKGPIRPNRGAVAGASRRWRHARVTRRPNPPGRAQTPPRCRGGRCPRGPRRQPALRESGLWAGGRSAGDCRSPERPMRRL